MSHKAKSKIAKAAARACATDLMAALQSKGEAEKLAADLVQKYTLGVRAVVMDQALDVTRGKGQFEIEEEAVASFIKVLIAAPKSQGLDNLIVSVAKFTGAILPERGSGWGTGLIAVELGRKEDGLASLQAFAAVGESLRNRDDNLAESLAYIVNAKAPVSAVQLWESMARPAIGDLSRPFSISQIATSQIVDELSKLSPENCSESLPLLISVLLAHTDSERRAKFFTTPLGQLLQKNLLGTGKKLEAGTEKDTDPRLGDDDNKLLNLIRQRLLDKNRELESVLEETEVKFAVELSHYQARLRQAQSEQSRLRGLLQRSQDDVTRMQSNEKQYVSELAERDKELARQAAEIRHLEREKINQETDQTDRHYEVLQKKLVEPAATVRDLVIELSEPTSSAIVEPRALAVAFDALHRRILNLAKVEDERIPRRILAGKKK